MSKKAQKCKFSTKKKAKLATERNSDPLPVAKKTDFGLGLSYQKLVGVPQNLNREYFRPKFCGPVLY